MGAQNLVLQTNLMTVQPNHLALSSLGGATCNFVSRSRLEYSFLWSNLHTHTHGCWKMPHSDILEHLHVVHLIHRCHLYVRIGHCHFLRVRRTSLIRGHHRHAGHLRANPFFLSLCLSPLLFFSRIRSEPTQSRNTSFQLLLS